MDQLPVNPADVGVIVILLISAILAFARGLVREVLSIAGWIGAALAALYAFSYAKPYLREFISITLIADAITILAIFLVTLVVLSLVSHQIAKHVRGSALSAIDRSLGFVFGLLRGAVLISLAYLLVAWLWSPEQRPVWLREAKTLPVIEAGAEALRRLVPEETQDQAAREAEAARRRAQEVLEAEEALRRLSTPRPAGRRDGGNDGVRTDGTGNNDAPVDDTGYKDRDRSDLDRLIENSN